MTSSIKVMLQQAKDAWDYAYAPYSGFVVGASLRTSRDQFFSCANVENASYGLSVCAEAGAIIKMVSSGEKEIAEMVVIGHSGLLCPPCGACRQRILEFAMPDIVIHLCTAKGVEKSLRMDELLPYSFGREHL